jgi:hypothetical protein
LKIALLSLSIGTIYKQKTKWSRTNKINYCKRHNYDFIEHDSVYDNKYPIPWSKIHLIHKYIDKYDYVVWMDSDLLIMNEDIKLETLISKYNNYDMIIGSDWKKPNTGCWFVKNSEFSKKFLPLVFENKYEIDCDRYGDYEQGSVINLYDKNHLDCKFHIKIANPNEINSYWFNYYPGDFILHFAGATSGDHNILEHLLLTHYPNRLIDDDDIMRELEDSYQNRKKILKNWREHIDKKLKN